MIASWFAFADQGQTFPTRCRHRCIRVAELRYGENPHQQAALYIPPGRTRRHRAGASSSRARS